MFSKAAAVFLGISIFFCCFCADLAAQSQPNGCAAIIARPNQQIGGADLSAFTPWGGQSGITRDISADPVDPYSSFWVASIKGDGNPFLMPDQVVNTVVVTKGQTRVSTPITAYPTVSDPGPFPVPLPPIIQGMSGGVYPTQGDRHLTVIDKGDCVLYELYGASYDPITKALSAGTSAVWDLQAGDHQRPYLWTGGSVSGIPWSMHALRYDEVIAGEIRHALTFAARNAWGRSAFTDMASSHQYGMGNQASLPPFGARARLRADYDVSQFSPKMQVVLTALKKYGMVYIDGGYPIDLHVEVDDRWDPQELNQLRNVFFAGNFEFIKTGPIYNDPMYGLAGVPPKGPAPVIQAFAASGSAVAAGTPVTLNWSVSGASSRIRIVTPGVGPVVTDSVVVTPATTTTYTLAVENAYGVSRRTVTVNVVAGDCKPGLPAINMSPASQNVSAGESASLLVSITNTDSSGCVPEQLALSHTLPAGWTGAYSEANLTVAPGASATATLTVAAPLDGAHGDTPITAAVSGMAGLADHTASVFFTPRQSLRLALSAVTIGGGKTVTATLTLATPAPAGGALVALSVSGDAAKAPSSVTIPAGSSSATFTISTVAVSTSSSVSISAAYGGSAPSASLRVDPAALWFLGAYPLTLDGGSSSRGNNLFLTGAVVADTVITMFSSDPSAASPPATVTIPAGASQASFTIATKPVAASKSVQITATYAGVSKSVAVTVRPATPALSALTLSPASLVGGNQSSQNTVALSLITATDTAIALTSGNPGVIVPAQVVIPAGASSTTFAITTSGVDTVTSAAISASYGGVSLSKTLTLNPAALSQVTVASGMIVGGSAAPNNTVLLSGAAGSAGASVSLSSANRALVTVPATVQVPAGSTSAPFTISTATVAAQTTVTVTASWKGVSKTVALTLTPPSASIGTEAAAPPNGFLLALGETAVSIPSGHIGSAVRVTIPDTAVAVGAQSGYFVGGNPGSIATSERVKVRPMIVALGRPGSYLIGHAELLAFPASGVSDASTFAATTMRVEQTPPGPGASDGTLKLVFYGRYTNTTSGFQSAGQLELAFTQSGSTVSTAATFSLPSAE